MGSGRKADKDKYQTRRVLSLRERIEVLQMAEIKRDTRELAKRFNCGRTQILSIFQQKERLLREWENNGDPSRLRRRPSPFSIAINKMVFEWINRYRYMQYPITDGLIVDRANKIKRLLKYTEYRPNRRWLERFKRRFKIESMTQKPYNITIGDNGAEVSLRLRDVFEDLKDTLDPAVCEVVANNPVVDDEEDLSHTLQFMPALMDTYSEPVNETNSENDLDYEFEKFCETQLYEGTSDSIQNDDEALECIKKLEEYTMLHDNYRALGLIMQLERLFKGLLEQ